MIDDDIYVDKIGDIDDSVLIARNFYDMVCDVEGALKDGEIREALVTLNELKSKIFFIVKYVNHDLKIKRIH